jgi:hypothetical protein
VGTKTKLKHWCGFPGNNALEAASVLEFFFESFEL